MAKKQDLDKNVVAEDYRDEPMVEHDAAGVPLVFKSREERLQWRKDHPLIEVDPDDTGEVPDEYNANL